MDKTLQYTLVPVIMGSGLRARWTAERIWHRTRARSYVMAERRSPILWLAPSLYFRNLSKRSGYADLILSDLVRVAQDHPDKLCVLIPIAPKDAAWVYENRSLLERYYILSDPRLSFMDDRETSPSPVKGDCLS